MDQLSPAFGKQFFSPVQSKVYKEAHPDNQDQLLNQFIGVILDENVIFIGRLQFSKEFQVNI
jgi:hypothetical protein